MELKLRLLQAIDVGIKRSKKVLVCVHRNAHPLTKTSSPQKSTCRVSLPPRLPSFERLAFSTSSFGTEGISNAIDTSPSTGRQSETYKFLQFHFRKIRRI